MILVTYKSDVHPYSILCPKNVGASWDDAVMCSPGVTAREAVLAGLAAFGPGVTDAVTLLGQVRDLAGFADQIQGELARLTGALDAIGGASEAGYSSTAAFLRHGCGRAAGRAGELVATGRALRSLAATEKALVAGEISFDAAHVIGRTAAQIPDAAMAQLVQEQMLAFARKPAPDPAGPDAPPDPDAGPGGGPPDGPNGPEPGPDGGDPGPGARPDQPARPGPGGWAAPALDPGQLRHLGEELLYRADPDGVEERERKRFERRHLSFGFTLDGSGTITGATGDALSAEIIKTAVHAFGPPLGAEDTRTAAQRRMDGLTAACAAALDSGAAGTRHGAAAHLSILVDEHTLAGTPAATGTSGPGAAGTACSCATGPGTSAQTGTTAADPPAPGPSGTGCSCPSGTPAASDPRRRQHPRRRQQPG